MRIRTFSYFIREAFKSLHRNSWLSLASAGTAAVSLIIVGMSLITILNTNYLAARLESNIEIISYLKDSVTVEQGVELKEEIEGIPGVAKVRFVTRDEAMLEFRKELGDQQNMVDALGGSNPLPNLYKITTISPQDVQTVANKLQGLAEMEKVDYGKGVIEKLFSITRWVRMVGLVVISLLGLAAIFLIATTTRLAVFARRKEIEIMRMLGASKWFIRWPFLLEGMVIGFSGAVIAVIVVDSAYLAFTDYIIRDLNFNIFGLQTDYRMLIDMGAAMLGAGTLLGALGSVISMRKFLKV
ncbi:MAG TPA: permease-like cell division protein FtsX [Desulfobacteria bacterium]|nr:permease-like cell division protein FtsX [Desulfobacteria bacterium]